MASADQLINAFTTLLVTIDPPGLAPIFLGLTTGMSRSQTRRIPDRYADVCRLWAWTSIGILSIAVSHRLWPVVCNAVYGQLPAGQASRSP